MVNNIVSGDSKWECDYERKIKGTHEWYNNLLYITKINIY